MGLTIDPSKITDLFLQRRSNSRQAVAEYLTKIAEEATALAEIWEDIAQELPDKTVDLREGTIATRLRRYNTPNTGPFYRLAIFYESLSSAIGGKVDHDFQESFVSRLGHLLYSRNLTLKEYQELVQKDNVPNLFLDASTRPDDFLQLDSLVEALHREAAALHVLAATYRVSQA